MFTHNHGDASVAIAVIGVGSVGKALGDGLVAAGHDVTFGVRDPDHPKREGLGRVVEPPDAVLAAVVILAIPVSAVPEDPPQLKIRRARS